MTTKYVEVRRLVDEAAIQAGREPGAIRIVGVSKRQPYEKIVDAVRDGLTNIGENRVQEVIEKKPLVEAMLKEVGPGSKALKWHMVGKLQSNKAHQAAQLFDVIQSVDTYKVAKKLSRTSDELGKELDVLIEVNVSGEKTKGGIKPDELLDFTSELIRLPAIRLKGLMTLGPLTEHIERISVAFRQLKDLSGDVTAAYPGLSDNFELSMGMSGDYQLAISAGATIVRIGTAIFGSRSPL